MIHKSFEDNIYNNGPLPHQRTEWHKLTPAERLRHSWSLRKRLKNPIETHDKKIFPSP